MGAGRGTPGPAIPGRRSRVAELASTLLRPRGMDPESPDQIAARLRHLDPKPRRAPRQQRVDPREDADADYRAAWGRDGKAPYGIPLRAAFYQYLPEAPKGRFAGRDDAARYVLEINRVIEMQQWSAQERERLRQLQRKWTARAEGRDARYLVLGTQGGINNKCRKKTAADIICAIRDAINESAGVKAAPTQKYVVDPKWPFGKPNPDRRV